MAASAMDPNSLLTGVQLGVYTLQDKIGAGGMGEVYRARDTRLGRDVAIKILPQAFTNNPDRLARFEREARVLAALNHPHIATLHGVEEHEDLRGLVMELLQGETLAERIRRGPVPVPEALAYARQIADALDAAHEKGITHRDLKPANIAVTPHGVKVLDFGLAKATADGTGSREAATITDDVTREGTVVGTPAYMSPEQLRGQPVDKRSDIWAFGCVLFEMLTARRAFSGASTSDTIAAILEREPTWTALPAATPAALVRVIRRCLEKDPRRRLRDVADARLELDDAGETSPLAAPRRSMTSGLWIPALAGALVLAAAAAAWSWWTGRQPGGTATSELRLELTTPPTDDLGSMAISPDGQRVVFSTDAATSSGLVIRELSSGASRLLPGTEGARQPFWSPDGRSLAFFADGRLKRLDIGGGTPQTLADASNPQGGSWSGDGTILFSPTQLAPITRVRASGGRAEAVTQVGSAEVGHVFPYALPDGARFLYTVRGNETVEGVYVGRLDGAPPKRILESFSRAILTRNDYLLFASNGALVAQRFDTGRMEVVGEPRRISDNVATENLGGPDSLAASASATGSLVYRERRSTDRQLVWYNRRGDEIARVGEPVPAPQQPALSPDGKQIALSRLTEGRRDIWLLDVMRTTLSRFTFENGALPVWTSDGSRIMFSSQRNGIQNVLQKPVVGGNEAPLVVTSTHTVPYDVSPDGEHLFYLRADAKTHLDIWAVAFQAVQSPFPVVQTPEEDLNPQVAPNGAWLAYQSNESGQYQVSVKPFPGAGRTLQVSTNGGTQPRWRADGRELFYVGLDRKLMAVPIAWSRDGQSLDAGVPMPLFQTQIGGSSIAQKEYAVAPDGQRFLVDAPVQGAPPPIAVILNWQPEP